ncbi:FMN-binding negative transcriptional regulator [Goodfellowiella coeruleoviolacea]|uniref:Negative transcriptional regulator, PaiB family n=1 Tax=Goodfellowiella coeruleoviolacea TaxID=334858 RepID=A0AAE3G8U5_9PSEU|nr:FMN-binding negative transcriptional regulator [Goodfellowiella coeruleoviolacea]MCP2163398.1 negative transcriptional regulator, PaiB family [Goodfellowiella coeruleoviolacea]
MVYRPDYFGPPDLRAQWELIEEYPLGLMALAVDGRPAAVHVPFVLDRHAWPYGRLRGHLSRGNPICAELANNVEVVVAFLGPSDYISPDNYATQPHFPTWAYAAVHVTGRPRLLDDVRLVRQLDDLIEDQEKRLAPKPPWSLPRQASPLFEEYFRLIQGFEIPIARIDGVFKLGQNKSAADMRAQARAFRARRTDSADRLADYIERHNNLERQEPGPRPASEDRDGAPGTPADQGE